MQPSHSGDSSRHCHKPPSSSLGCLCLELDLTSPSPCRITLLWAALFKLQIWEETGTGTLEGWGYPPSLLNLLSLVFLACVSFPPLCCQSPWERAVSSATSTRVKHNEEKETCSKTTSITAPVLNVVVGTVQELRWQDGGREQETSFL